MAMLTRRALSVLLVIGAVLSPVLSPVLGAGRGPARAQSSDPILLGDLNSYTALPAFTEPYRQGWRLALAEINNAGGLLGRRVEVISRDDGGAPGDAVTVANALMRRENVSLLFGTLLSNVGLAVGELAARREVPFIAAEPLSDTIAWSRGNAWTFRLRPGTHVQAAMLAEEAADLAATRWATLAPNYEYGKSAVAAFKAQLTARRDDVTFVGEQWPPLFEIDAGATAEALRRTEPEAIFNVTFGVDLSKFVRQGRARGLFEDRPVVSMLSGEPEWINPLGAEAPEGWIVTGYPWYAIERESHQAFVAAYQRRFDADPRMGSLVGYSTMKAIAAAIERAGTAERAALRTALEGLPFDTPIGELRFREADNQSTMGTWVGRLTVREGQPRMVDWRYGAGEAYLPPPEEARDRRP